MWIGVLATFLAVCIGGVAFIMSEPTTPPRRRWLYRAIFIVCSLATVVLVGVQGRKADKAEERTEKTQGEMQKGLAEVKSLVTQPNPDRETILSKLDELSQRVSPAGSPGLPLAVPIATPYAQTAYSRLSNKELKQAVAVLVTRLADLAQRDREAAQATSQKADQLFRSATTEDERNRAWEQRMNEETQRYQRRDTEYKMNFRARATLLRDEMLQRLPASPDRDHGFNRQYDMLSGVSPIEDIVLDLQRLALLLP